MFKVMLSLLLLAELPPGKELPPSEEPNWALWDTVDSQAVDKASEAWRDALRGRLATEDTEDLDTITSRELAGWATLEKGTPAACAAGAKILRASQNELERMWIATMMVGYQKEKALPFLAWTLVKIGDQRFLDEHCSLAQGAAAQLARAHNPSYLRALFVILRNRTCLVEFWEGGIQDLTRECAFAAIGPYGEDALPYLHPLLRDNDPYVRRNAAFTLGIFLDDAGKPMFLDMLAAKDVAAGGAAFALGELGATEAGGRIAPLLGSAEPTTRLCAAHALGKMGIRGALPALEAAAAVEKDWRTQAEMEAAIREIQSPAQPLGSGCRKLDPRELEVALADAERNPGIFLDVAEVAASAGPQELAQMKKIRLKLLREEWKGCKLGGPFWVWTDAIKEVKKRR